MSFRIFITGSGIIKDAQDILKAEGCVLMQGDPADSPADLEQKVSKFRPDALIVRQGRINNSVISAAGNLKVICKHGIGIDNIDTEAASGRDIPVMYTPDANYESVAEHTLALMLSLVRNIPQQDRTIRRGVFDKTGFSGQELRGKTLGLIGFGRIARRLSELLAPFHVKVVVYHPSGTEEDLPSYISKVPSVGDIYSQSDIISLHVPLTADTRGMIDSEAFDKMKKEAYLINTARGPVVNEGHLIEAIRSGQIRGAALDTFEVEPLAPDSPLFQLDNVILTIHTAGNSDVSLRNMAMGSVNNVLAVMRNEPLDPRMVANSEDISAARMSGHNNH